MIWFQSPLTGTRTSRGGMITATGAALALTLAVTSPAQANCAPDSTEGIVGGIAGAVIGGFLGSKVGSGSGRTAAMIGGAALGGLLGNNVATRLTCQDQQAAYRTTQASLENYPTGQPASWNNPDSGNYGTVTPIRSYTGQAGRDCREFEQKIFIDGKPETGYGKACRQPDGSWQIVSQ